MKTFLISLGAFLCGCWLIMAIMFGVHPLIRGAVGMFPGFIFGVGISIQGE